MTFADLKSPVLLTLLGVFAVGWLALYGIMANRIASAQDMTVSLHGQQGEQFQAQHGQHAAALSNLHNQLTSMNGTLERVDERTAIILDRLREPSRTSPDQDTGVPAN